MKAKKKQVYGVIVCGNRILVPSDACPLIRDIGTSETPQCAVNTAYASVMPDSYPGWDKLGVMVHVTKKTQLYVYCGKPDLNTLNRLLKEGWVDAEQSKDAYMPLVIGLVRSPVDYPVNIRVF